MNIIKCVAWRNCLPLWEEWTKVGNKNTMKINTSRVYIDQECIEGVVPKRTFAFIRETPGDETTAQNILGCSIVYSKEISSLKVGVITNFGVDPAYKGNGIDSQLLSVCMAYMYIAQFNASIAIAPVANNDTTVLLEKNSYVTILEQNNNTVLYRPIHGLPLNCSLDNLRSLAAKLIIK